MDSYSTLPSVTREAVTGVEGYPGEGYYNTRWLTGLWSTQAKVEGIMLKAVWHWGRVCSVINDPLGEPGYTPLYVGLLSTWGSMDGEHMLSPFFVGGLLKCWTLTDINERINHWLWREPVGEDGGGGGSFTKDFEGKVNY